MANSRYVNTNFWKDNYVADLDPTEKLVFIYLLTNPRATLAGAYEINLREIAFDTGIDKDMVIRIMERFESDERIIMDSGWVVLLNYQKHQKLNPNGLVQVGRIFSAMPASLSMKLAQSSTFLARCSMLLSLQRKSDGTFEYNRGIDMPKVLIDKAIQSLLHIEDRSIEDRSNIDTKVSILAQNAPVVEKTPKIASAEINEMFAHWELTIGYKIESRIRQNRFACSNLLKKHGREGVVRLVNGVSVAKEDRFAPRIADFTQLQQKYNELVSWGHSQNKKGPKVAR